MYPIENLSTSSTLPLKMRELALEIKSRLCRYWDRSYTPTIPDSIWNELIAPRGPRISAFLKPR